MSRGEVWRSPVGTAVDVAVWAGSSPADHGVGKRDVELCRITVIISVQPSLTRRHLPAGGRRNRDWRCGEEEDGEGWDVWREGGKERGGREGRPEGRCLGPVNLGERRCWDFIGS